MGSANNPREDEIRPGRAELTHRTPGSGSGPCTDSTDSIPPRIDRRFHPPRNGIRPRLSGPGRWGAGHAGSCTQCPVRGRRDAGGPGTRAGLASDPGGAARRPDGLPSGDVPTHRTARWAACHLRPPARVAQRVGGCVRAGRLPPGIARRGRRRALHGAPHVQGDGRLSVEPGDQRGGRGCRRLRQRGHGSRVHGLLGACPAPPGSQGDRRHGRAGRAAHAGRGRHRPGADGDRRGDPLLPRRSGRVLPDPDRAGALRRRAARPRDLRRGSWYPGAARSADPGVLERHVPPGEHRRGGRGRHRPRRGGRACGEGVRFRLRPGSRVRARADDCPPAHACSRAVATRPRPSSRSPSPRSGATIPTPGAWPCSTGCSATGCRVACS